MEEAGLILAVFDAGTPLTAEDLALARRCANRPALAVLNKQDVACADVDREAEKLAPYFARVLPLCARDPASLAPLCAAVAGLLGTAGLDPNAAALCSERQLSAAAAARDALREAAAARRGGFGLDAVSVCVEDALRALYELTGEDAAEAVLDEVFARFCVGK